jgi:DNA-directed RNA polymerase specialized sigma24 family protein
MNREHEKGDSLNKQNEAQMFLARVEMIDTLVENKLIEQRQWKDLALSITANMGGEKVQSSSTTTSKMEDAVIRCIMIEDEIAAAVDKLICEKKKVVQLIEKLYSPTEYRILHMRYIQYISLTDIADRLNRDYTWVTTTHGRALKHVQKILDGGSE